MASGESIEPLNWLSLASSFKTDNSDKKTIISCQYIYYHWKKWESVQTREKGKNKRRRNEDRWLIRDSRDLLSTEFHASEIHFCGVIYSLTHFSHYSNEVAKIPQYQMQFGFCHVCVWSWRWLLSCVMDAALRRFLVETESRRGRCNHAERIKQKKPRTITISPF